MKYLLTISFMFSFLVCSVQAQDLVFEYLDAEEVSGNCTSSSDSTTNVQCYAVRYTPGGTGDLTSYTLGFFASCTSTGNAYVSDGTSSCVMTDNSTSIDACATSFNTTLLQLSGNSGSFPITQGVTFTVHQVCFDVPLGDTIILTKDETSGHTFSIDPQGGLPPFTDEPIYVTQELTNEFACEESTLCSVGFGTSSEKIDFTENAMGNIVDAVSLENTFSFSQSFDVYDEINMSCISPGGENDITFDFQLLNTIDINGNGLIDTLAGVTHNIKQGPAGIEASIPFNTSADTESSAGDIRGYSVQVTFANHIGIIADQLDVHLEGMNTASSVFESAAIVFQDQFGNDYGTFTHNGFYVGANDLSGNCNDTNVGTSFTITGPGALAFQDITTVDVTLPCDIGLGVDGSKDSPIINARVDAGLDSMATIGGFRLIVYGEDIEAPSVLDDGSGTAPDDGIAANTQSAVSALLESTISGITVKGCVFATTGALPLKWEDVTAIEKNDDVHINWVTWDEVNTDNFEIEWSRDGRSFDLFGYQDAKNTPGRHNYKYVHQTPATGLNYYRIKQIDLDGRYVYSPIVSVLKSASGRFMVYPNPASNRLNITPAETGAISKVVIIDSNGAKVLSTETDSNTLDISGISDGLFKVIVYRGEKVEFSNFVKMKQ